MNHFDFFLRFNVFLLNLSTLQKHNENNYVLRHTCLHWLCRCIEMALSITRSAATYSHNHGPNRNLCFTLKKNLHELRFVTRLNHFFCRWKRMILNGKPTKALNIFKTLWYDRRAKLDKTLLERLIKTWVDNRNDDNSRYYIPINFPLLLHPFKNRSKCVIYHVLSIYSV